MHRRRHPEWLGVRASDIPNADVVKDTVAKWSSGSVVCSSAMLGSTGEISCVQKTNGTHAKVSKLESD